MKDQIRDWILGWMDWIFIDMWIITYPAIVFFIILSATDMRTDSSRNDLANAWLFIWGFIYLIWFTSTLVDIREAVVG